MASDKPWSQFSEADYTEEQYARACLIDTGKGEGKQRYALPVREPGGALNRNGCHAAAGRINQVSASPEKKAAAARKLVGLYRGELDEEPPEGLLKMAGMSTASRSAYEGGVENERGPIEFRDSRIDGVNFKHRIITVIAVPYERPGVVEYRGQLWKEIFERSAFEAVEAIPNRVRVNRGHDKNRTCGKVAQFPRGVSEEGLVADCRIAKTALGDETLALADEDCLSASVGYAVVGNGQRLERRSMTRRITNAYLDHLALVESPTYTDARVLSVRSNEPLSEPLPPLETSNLDSAIAEMRNIMEWSAARLKRQ